MSSRVLGRALACGALWLLIGCDSNPSGPSAPTSAPAVENAPAGGPAPKALVTGKKGGIKGGVAPSGAAD